MDYRGSRADLAHGLDKKSNLHFIKQLHPNRVPFFHTTLFLQQ
jgi:hypothetical protein